MGREHERDGGEGERKLSNYYLNLRVQLFKDSEENIEG